MARVLTIDASVAVKWLVEEQGTVEALALAAEPTRFVAPDLIFAEVSNVLWRNARQGLLDPEQAIAACKRLPVYLSVTASCRELVARALEIALVLKHPTYDCFYVACAEVYGAPLVTADRRLLGALASHSELSRHVLPLHA